MKQSLITFSQNGIYCPQAGIHIDPWKPVETALLTHLHADHARPGSSCYLFHESALAIFHHRIGQGETQTLRYHEPFTINGVTFTLHPAGHILGSSQIKIENEEESWVITGDYHTQDNPTAPTALPPTCDYLIIESTFGLPIFSWEDQQEIYSAINAWWEENQRNEKASVLICYSLGKAQRILNGINPETGPIFTHGATETMTQCYRDAGISLPHTEKLDYATHKDQLSESLILAPVSVMGTSWLSKLKPYSLGYASGWMQLRGARRRKAVDRGFILSDHADFNGLVASVKASGAKKVYVTHGYTSPFAKYLNSIGIPAEPINTEFGDDESDD